MTPTPHPRPGRRSRYVPKRVPVPENHQLQSQILDRLRAEGIPVSKPGFVYWLKPQLKKWLKSGIVVRDVTDSRGRLFFSEPAIRAARHWAASQYLAFSMANNKSLIAVSEFAEQQGTTIGRLHFMAKGAIAVIGRGAYVSPALAARIEEFILHRKRAFVPPSNREQNASIVGPWLDSLNLLPETWKRLHVELTGHLDEPTSDFLRRTLPSIALELAKEKPELAKVLFQRRNEWVPRAQRGIVAEGFIPEANVFQKLQRINPRLTEKQARAFLLRESGKNPGLFSGSYSENYGKRRFIIPLAAANRLAEQMEEENERLQQGEREAASTIAYRHWGSPLSFEAARKRVAAIPKRVRRLGIGKVAKMLEIHPAMVNRLVAIGQLELYLEMVTVTSLQKEFRLR